MFIAFIIFAILAGLCLVGLVLTSITVGNQNPDHDLYPICSVGFVLFTVISLFLAGVNYGVITFN